MADFTKTITNSVRCFGGSPATLWGQNNGSGLTMLWGTSLWGDGTIVYIYNIGKLIQETQGFTEDYTYSVGYIRVKTGMVSPSDAVTLENLSDGSIWKYVFTSDTTNLAERDSASYVSGTGSSTSFTCQASNSNSWTEV